MSESSHDEDSSTHSSTNSPAQSPGQHMTTSDNPPIYFDPYPIPAARPAGHLFPDGFEASKFEKPASSYPPSYERKVPAAKPKFKKSACSYPPSYERKLLAAKPYERKVLAAKPSSPPPAKPSSPPELRMQQSDQPDFVSVSITEKLANLAPSSVSSIYKVHKQLRSINEKAYEPEIVAIGPYHHGKENLKSMEEHKLRYLQELLQRENEINADKYIIGLRSLEFDSRRYYAEAINYTDDEFVEMLLLDACFVVEVIRKFEMAYLRSQNEMAYLRSQNDPIFQMDWIVVSLQRDLMLFENQLPLEILCKLFDLIENTNNHSRFMYLALCFFEDLIPGTGYGKDVDPNSAPNKHLLELIHNHWRPSKKVSVAQEKKKEKKVSEKSSKTKSLLFIPSVTALEEAGVHIKKAEEGSLFDITFEGGVLKIPILRMEDRTETFLRNLVAYEEYSPDIQLRYITDYVKFIDCLINTEKDVEILSHHKIVDNWLGDNEVVSGIFNKITDVVAGPSTDFMYTDTFYKLNKHCIKYKNRWMAMLRRDYCNSPWAVISVIAAFILLVLTFAQTFLTAFPQ